MTKLLTKKQIKNTIDETYEDVNVPEWGGVIRIKALSGAERDAFEASVVGNKVGKKAKMNMGNMRARLVAIAAIDEEGNRLFDDNDIVWLTTKSAAALDRAFGVAQKLAGISDDDLEDLEGNLKDPNVNGSTI